jgi:hypothetical protein
MVLMFTHPNPPGGSPPGDGIMKEGRVVVMLRGEEGAVNSVTKGQFLLKFKKSPKPNLKYNNEPQHQPKLDPNPNTDLEHSKEPQQQPNPDPDLSLEYRSIGLCSMLLLVQFLAQLLLIPQGTLFGQVMFLSTLTISWAYNSYLSSLDGETIQRKLLVEEVFQKPTMKRFQFGTWTSMTVFALLTAQSPEPQKLLESLIPNNTEVWMRWKEWVLDNIKPTASGGQAPPFEGQGPSSKNLETDQKELLSNLVEDAKSAYRGFRINHSHLTLLGIALRNASSHSSAAEYEVV